MKNRKIKIFILISMVAIVAVGILGIYIINNVSDKKNNQKKSVIIPEIEFPVSMGGANDELIFENKIDEKNIKNKDIIDEVLIVSNTQLEKKREEVKKAFDMQSIDITETEDAEIYRTEDSTLLLYNNGSYMYRSNNKEDKEINLSDDSCIEIAENFLKENGLLPDEFSSSGIGYDTLTDLSHPEDEIIIAKQIYFSRNIDNIEVDGNSKIYVSIDSNGEISEAYSAYRDVDDRVSVNEVIELGEAVDKVLNSKGFIAVEENADKVVLENVEIIYWEDSAEFSTNSTIQPVYKITGKSYQGENIIGEFEAIESAVR